MEYLWHGLRQTDADAAVIESACVPESDNELNMHRHYLHRKAGIPPRKLEAVTDAETVLWSKIEAVLSKQHVLDSFHHGSVVELWALCRIFSFEAIIWGGKEDGNIRVSTLEALSDEQAKEVLRNHVHVMEVLYRPMGCTGHYDIIKGRGHTGMAQAVSGWEKLWLEAGSKAVREAMKAEAAKQGKAEHVQEVVSVPGDGYCLFHCVCYFFQQGDKGAFVWDQQRAAGLYLRALEYLWHGLRQTDADAAVMESACVPESDNELNMHRQYLHRKAGVLPRKLEAVTDAETVLWSKIEAVLSKQDGLDSFHHGSVVELWALCRIFSFEAIIWGTQAGENYRVSTLEAISSEEVKDVLAKHTNVMELVYQGLGCTGHYDVVKTSVCDGLELLMLGWEKLWREGGSRAVRQVLKQRPAMQQERDSTVWSDESSQDSCKRQNEKPEDVEGQDGSTMSTESEVEGIQGLDIGDIRAAEGRRILTPEDDMEDRCRAIRVLLQEFPMHPKPLQGWSAQSCGPMAGVAYPAAHCAFAGCHWNSDAEPCVSWHTNPGAWAVHGSMWKRSTGACCGDSTQCLWAHLWAKHRETLAVHGADTTPEVGWCAYKRALVLQEERNVPALGWSVDRRTLRRLRSGLQEHECAALICACCAGIHSTGTRANCGYVSVKVLFGSLTKRSLDANWNAEEFEHRYQWQEMAHGQEWERKLPGNIFAGQRVLCCPEDIRCDTCQGRDGQLCEDCQIPLCRKCWDGMRHYQDPRVPEALTNDNWYGYPWNFLYEEKVRWIEAAAASPVWTSIVIFYIEGDRGHLMEEELHRGEVRAAARGNISSFSMPWEEIYGNLQSANAADLLDKLPHPPEALSRMVKFTVKGMKHSEIVDWVAGAKIRPWVVLKLLEHLLDIGHPMCRGRDKATLCQEFKEKVAARYGDVEMTPANVQQVLEEKAKKGNPTPHQKHATPAAASLQTMDGEAYQGSLRPEILSEDYTSGQLAHRETMEVTRLGNVAKELSVVTGNTFWDQWQSRFLSWAYPFSLPLPVGGPDFPSRPRDRRKEEAARLTPIAHLRALARRVESSIRNSGDLVPGVRRITMKWHSVWNAKLWRTWRNKKEQVAEIPASTWVRAAERLYERLRKGKYCTGKQLKPIDYDTRKLWYAEGLTKPEREILIAVRNRQQTMPGTVEVRKQIGRYLFGARVELGEPLFVTVSPTTRHNGLCMRFSRYRARDPAAQEMRGPWFARDKPPLWNKDELADIDLPDYEVRRALTARDPWATVLAFQRMIRFVFGELLGIRLCPDCPHCACNDQWGQGFHVGGGVLGLVKGICGAIEYQSNSAPHFHGHVYTATVWQQPLKVLAEQVEQQLMTKEKIFQFHQWVHNEVYFDKAKQELDEAAVERSWAGNYQEEAKNQLSLWPQFLANDHGASPWLDASMTEAAAMTEAADYKNAYKAAVQEKMLHYQHHVHPWDKERKERKLLPACHKKGSHKKCKHNFPKKLNLMPRVICRGNSRKYGVSTRGRRNALGAVLGQRHNEWLSGTAPAFSLMLMGNSHTAPNFRVPLCKSTHDEDCKRKCLEKLYLLLYIL